MKKFLYSLKTDLRFEEPVNNHTFLLRASPLVVPSQEPMRVSLSCSPACGLGVYKDAFGNLVHQGYLEQGHDSFTFCSTGEVLIDVSKKDYSEPAPYYLSHTPLTRLEGALAEYFLEFKTTGSADQVTDYWVSRISCDFRYQKGVTTTSTTASEAWEIGEGVCQDYSHILLSVLRAQGVPCRYIAGLLQGEGATHAWVEYFNGEYWVGVDPTHNAICNDRYMKISQGIDFSSCSLEKGVFLGGGAQVMLTKSGLIEL